MDGWRGGGGGGSWKLRVEERRRWRRRGGVVLVDLPSRIGRHSQKDPFSFSTTPFLFAAQPRTVIEQQHAS